MPLTIPEIPLLPQPQTEEARAALGDPQPECGLRHKLGGTPDWIQEEAWPSCPSCRERMTFYGQLDSLGGAFDLADCGLVLVFVCFDCFETTAVLDAH
jgi:hypothetical protein